MAHGDELGEFRVQPGTGMATTTAIGLVQQLSETLGTPEE
jgi:hypothetical protein